MRKRKLFLDPASAIFQYTYKVTHAYLSRISLYGDTPDLVVYLGSGIPLEFYYNIPNFHNWQKINWHVGHLAK